MAILQKQISVAAGAEVELLTDWPFQRVPALAFPNGAYLALLAWQSPPASATPQMLISVTTGSSQVVSPGSMLSVRPGDSTERGTIPSQYDVPLIDWQSDPDDIISIRVKNTTSEAETVAFYVSIEPIQG